ncbi:MAG TPA: tetratricopeptide repeat protein, partial [Gemmataceae bacterium]|nr:tetratricopeptide repeat protein [Gemmataceae bacterium]
HPELEAEPEAALELVAEEICLRAEAGLDPGAAELARRFPRWARQVQALLDCHLLMAPQPAPPRFPAPGESLGDFRLLAELGRGAHGRVFLARQPALADRPVVLKLGPGAGREHLSLSRLQHTHVVPLYSVHDFPERGLRGLCQPYFGGASLADLLGRLDAIPAGRRTGLDLLRALERARTASAVAPPVGGPACEFLARASYVRAVCWLGACLADALHYAHERGLVHLDLKPSNVLIAADGQPMLLDFHLARAPLAAGGPAPSGLGGTPGYMAPEQRAALAAVAEGRPVPRAVDARADVYGLGMLLYGTLGGTVPAPPRRPGDELRRNGRVSAGLADLLARCLAANPAARYRDAGEVAADLRRHLADLPLRGVANRSPAERWRKWRRRRPHALPLFGLLLAAVAGVGLLGVHATRQTRAAEAALRQGEDQLRRGHYDEALDAFRHGAALSDDLPLDGRLRRQLRDGADRAERGRTAEELHRLCERLRPLYAADALPPEEAAAVADRCRALWEKREVIASRLGDQTRTDLLDLAILWANLRGHAADPGDARREELETLAQAEAMFGPTRVLCEERRAQLLALGRAEAAEEAGRQAAALTPCGAWEHYALGRAYLRDGDLRRARDQLDRALELDPQSLWTNFAKGLCAHRMGQYHDALAAFSACVALAPQSAACLYNRGRAYEALGCPDRAAEDFERAAALSGESRAH